MVTGTGAEDSRSDDEGDEEEEDEETQKDKTVTREAEIILNAGRETGLKRADSGYMSGTAGTSALSSLIMNGNGHTGSTHRHISSKLNGGDMH